MKIYLDTCSSQRPLDSKTSIRIVLEAEAVLGILTLCESGQIELVSSEVLLFEIDQNPNMMRQEYAWEVLSKAKTYVMLNEQIEKRARKFDALGLKPLDALHLASAEGLNRIICVPVTTGFSKGRKLLQLLKREWFHPLS
ncbi:MAG: PIN domain-containing protein [Anaerolineae bacterium]